MQMPTRELYLLLRNERWEKWKFIFFFFFFKLRYNWLAPLLDSGVQYNDLVFLYMTKWSQVWLLCHQSYILTTFPMLCITFLLYFLTGRLYLLIFLTYFTHLPTCLPCGNHQFVHCIHESLPLMLICILQILHKWNHMLSYSNLFHLAKYSPRFIHVIANGNIFMAE